MTFDAMRHAAQCVGRVLRGKTDYGLMIFADKRFARADKRDKLPRWIAAQINEAHSNLSSDMALVESVRFLKQMAQDMPTVGKNGVSLWDVSDIEIRQAKEREHFERLMLQNGKAVEDGEVKMNGQDGMDLDEDEEFDKAFGTGEDLVHLDTFDEAEVIEIE